MSSASRNHPAKRKNRSAGNVSKGPAFMAGEAELPTNYVVRPPPQTSVLKSIRHLRRIYLHRAVLRGLEISVGSIVVIRHELAHASEEEEGISIAFGIAWPSDTVDYNVVQIHPMLCRSHLIDEGDRVRLSKFQGGSQFLQSIIVCCIDDPQSHPHSSEDDDWRQAIKELLPEIRYITEGMEFECAVDGRLHAYTVVAATERSSASDSERSSLELMKNLDALSMDDSASLFARFQEYQKRTEAHTTPKRTSEDAESDVLPTLYMFDAKTDVVLSHRPQSTDFERSKSPRPLRRHDRSSATSSPLLGHASSASKPTNANRGQTRGTPSASSPKTSAKASKPTKSMPNRVPDGTTTPVRTAEKPRIVEIDTDEESEIVRDSKLPKVTYESIGGLSAQISSLREIVELPLLKPHVFARFNMSPPRGVLLYGPPGTGKTMMLRAVASETSARVFTISGPSIISKYMGEAEEKLRKLWLDAEKAGPSIIFIDEVDAITPKREADSGEAESRIVASLLTLMDGMDAESKVVVIGATNRPNSIDPALRRPGRFDREIEIGIPDAKARLEILSIMLDRIPHNLSSSYIQEVASKTHGFVGADISAVCRESVIMTIKSGMKSGIPEDQLLVEETHMQDALPLVRPSAMREIFLETTATRWTDIGGQEDVKQKLKESVEWPLTHPETFKRLGIIPAKGVLLFGPPGCSKTLTAKALATEAGLNFMAVKGPELFNKYVGEAERALREIFRKARAASPSIIFFDEIDALSGSRGGDGEGSSDRILTTLLNEIDGVEDLVNVTILAATNRPDVIDSALLRPGRLDRLLYVGPPDLISRQRILEIQFSRMSIADDVSIAELADTTDGCSGAEIAACCRDAGLVAMQQNLDARQIHKADFDMAMKRLKRGITPEMIDFYETFASTYGA